MYPLLSCASHLSCSGTFNLSYLTFHLHKTHPTHPKQTGGERTETTEAWKLLLTSSPGISTFHITKPIPHPNTTTLHPGRLTAGTYKWPIWKGKWSEPNLHSLGFQPLIFRGGGEGNHDFSWPILQSHSPLDTWLLAGSSPPRRSTNEVPQGGRLRPYDRYKWSACSTPISRLK